MAMKKLCSKIENSIPKIEPCTESRSSITVYNLLDAYIGHAVDFVFREMRGFFGIQIELKGKHLIVSQSNYARMHVVGCSTTVNRCH